jgi:RHS repeat-associated protein
VEPLEERLLLSAANQARVSGLYGDLLQRSPDPVGLNAWTALLDQGSTAAQVVLGIEESPEYQTKLITQLYGAFLHRPPDPGGLASFVSFLQHGGTAERAKAIMLGSSEYAESRGGGTSSGFLSALYQDVLGRLPDPAGEAGWSQMLQWWSHRTVAELVVDSPEAQQHLVQGFYQQILHRIADPAGLTAYVTALQHGTQLAFSKQLLFGGDDGFDPVLQTLGQTEVIAFMAGSPEYANLRQPPPPQPPSPSCGFDDHLTGWTVTQTGGSAAGQGSVVADHGDAVLREGDSFTVSLERSFTIPQAPSALTFDYAALNLDPVRPNTMPDAFEAAFVDANGRSLVQTISPGKDAFFNITDGQSPDLAAGTTLEGQMVTVNLAGLPPGSSGRLIFRLVNNDHASKASVHITCVMQEQGNYVEPLATPPRALVAAQQQIDFSLLSDVSSSFVANYGRTSFNRGHTDLFTDVAVRHAGTYSVGGPLVVAIAHLSDPSVRVANPAGITPDGLPYFIFSGPAGDIVRPGDVTAAQTLSFFNPDRVRFTYDLVVLAELNQPPEFTSLPSTEGIPGVPYVYQATAQDRDHDRLTFALLSGPTGMAVDAHTGKVTWSPQTADLGTQAVDLQVNDGRGATARQQFTISVIDPPPNRPPVFTSSPVVDANVNTPYTYQAAASDPDGTKPSDANGETLTFSVVVGPQGLTIGSSSGLVSWTPTGSNLGTDNVTLQVDDGRGGTATQTYTIAVQQAPGNLPPHIISTPIRQLNLPPAGGSPVTYQYPVKAIDADKDPLTYSLTTGPTGMTIDPGSGLITWNGPGVPAGPSPGPPPSDGLTLTAAGTVAGFSVTDFANGFPVRSNGFGPGGIAFPDALGGKQVLVTDGPGNIRLFSTDTDGQSAASAQLLGNFGDTDAGGLAQVNGQVYMTQNQSGQVVRLNADGSIAEAIAAVPGAIGIVADPSNGHLFVSGSSSTLFDIDPITHSVTPLVTGLAYPDGLTISPDGSTLYAALLGANQVAGFDAHSGNEVFVSSSIRGVDGIALGFGSLAGFIVANTNYGEVWQVDLNNPANQVLIAYGGTRGDFVTVDPNDGTLLLTQSANIVRLHPPASASFAQDFKVGVRVDDGRGAFDTQNYVIHVTQDQPGTILGTVFNDHNGSGILTNGDEGLPGRTVYLDLDHNGTLDLGEPSTSTDPLGQYAFTGLVPGTYTVAEVGQPGWQQTGPPGGTWTVTVQSGQVTSGVDFGNTQQGVAPGQRPPKFTSTPPTTTAAGQLYRYDPAVSNPDGRPLTFDMPVGPVGMAVDTITGAIAWTPGALQLGPQQVLLRVRDDQGSVDIQGFRITVAPVNTAPVITSRPPAPAVVGQTYQYPVRAQDAEGDPITYRLDAAPVGMSIDGQSGMLSWTPTANDAGYAYASTVLQDSPAGYWRLGEQSGTTAVDSSPNHLDGSYQGGVSLGAPGALVGDPNTAVQLAGQGEYVQLPSGFTFHNTTDGTFQGLTLEVWADPTRVGNWQRFFDLGNGPNSDDIVLNRVSTDNTLGFFVANSGNTVGRVEAANAIELNRWQYFAATLDPSGNVTLYKDGQVIATGASGLPNNITHTANFLGKSQYDADAYYAGGLDEAAIYNEALSADQVRSHFNAGIRTHHVAVTADDGHGGQDTQSFDLPVVFSASNQPPAITSTPSTAVGLGQTYFYAVQASDADGDPLTYTLAAAPSGMTIGAAGLIVWRPAAGQSGANGVKLQVNDGRGGVAEQDFAVTVVMHAVTQPPAVISTPPLAATVGRPYQYDLEALDPQGNPVVWSLDTAPAGMSIDSGSGTLRWVPTVDQIGPQNVVVRVTDSQGEAATQSFTIQVRGVNVPPVITSIPPTQAAVGSTYQYAAQATDADGDPLSYALTIAPAGMTIDAGTGAILWTPDMTEVGPQNVAVQVDDGQGGVATQTYQVVVAAQAPNQSPAITSVPVQQATVGQLYQYQVVAADPDGDPVTYALSSGPAGMKIDPATGLVQWTPTAAQVGPNVVTLAAVDPADARGMEQFTVVAQVNLAPQITSTPVTAVTAGLGYEYDVQANDPDGDTLTYTVATGPGGMTIDALGRVRWSPAAGDIGMHHVVLSVADSLGAAVTQTFDVQVSTDTQPPQVSLVMSANPADIGTPVTFIVSATDDVAVQSLTLTVGGTPLPLDANGQATMTASQVGQLAVVATATDPAGNQGTASDTLTVINPQVTTAPEVAITAPADGAVITSPTDVTGTANDPNLLSYTLEVAPFGSTAFTQIASGTQSIVNGVLGKFDPSGLANDTYVLRLTATNTGGLVSQTDIQVSVAGNLKLGNFTLAFTDLSIPVSGVPITVSRIYDSLNAGSSSDFGYGWHLDFRHTDLRSNVPPVGPESVFFFNPFRDGTRLYVTLPGGQRQGFTFQPVLNRATELLLETVGLPEEDWLYDAAFQPDPGVTSQLSLTGATTLLRDLTTGEYFSAIGHLPFNPADNSFFVNYILTTKDGLAYEIDAPTSQLRRIVNPNGNSVSFSDAGISSSTGQLVTFQRDAQGRIAAMVDPAGRQIAYQYDSHGDLVAVTDRDGNTTQFVYDQNRPHYLDQVIDPLGRTGAQAEYDDQGRLIKTTDGGGNATQLLYDPDHSTETVKDALGNPTTYEYDQQGNIVTEINALGGVTQRTYDANNNMLTETDPLGRTTAYSYDAAGNVLTTTDPLGNVTQTTYETFAPPSFGPVGGGSPYSLPQTITDPLGNTFTTTYDALGNATRSVDPLGNAVTIANDNSGNPTTVTDLAGNTRQFVFCSCGSLLQETDPLGTVTSYTRDANDRELTRSVSLTTPSGPRTLTTATTYDANGNVLSVTDPDGGVTRYEYDSLGHQTAVIDPLGHRTEYRFDASGRHVETLYADGTTETFAYDADGRRVAYSDRAGRTTRYKYDELGRLVTTILPDDTPADLADNPRLRTEYDAAGQITAEIDPLGHRTEYTYDADGRQTVLRDALGEETLTSYDADGRRVSVTDALGRTSKYEYDARGLLVGTVFPDGTSTQSAFDGMLRLTTATDQAGATTRYEYDAAGRLATVVDALGGQTNYAYDEVGNLVRQTDANGNLTKYGYDGLGHRTSTVLPLGQRSLTTYDAAGNVATTTDFNGNTISYDYDSNNRLIAKHFPDGTSTTFTYTPTGQEATVTDARGVTRYQYDAADRLVSRTDPDGTSISYTYDGAGNRTSVTIPAGTTSYNFDPLDRLATVTDPNGGVTHYTYDAAGNLLRTDLPNGTAETRSYDALNRLIFLQNLGPNGTISSYQYTLDPTGNRLSVLEDTGRKVNYTYDALYRLTEEAIADPTAGNRTIDYTYDAVGNRLTRTDTAEGQMTYAYDANGRLVTETLGSDVTKYTYDDNGNTLSKIIGATDQVFMTWDFENRLIGVDETDASGTHHIQNQYDANGIRVSQKVDGQETRYLIDAAQPFAQVLMEYTPGGSVNASYVYGQRLISQNRGGVSSYYLVDGLGSTRALTNASGAVTDRYVYDAFGRTIGQAGATANAYLFAGQQRDAVTGWDYLRARYLDADLGRFLSRDPFPGVLANPVSLQAYPYADLNPVNMIDPSGRFTLSELSATEAVQEALFYAQLGSTVGTLCRVGAVAGVLGTLFSFADLYFGFMSAVNQYGFKPGLEFQTWSFNPWSPWKKAALRMYQGEHGPILQIALDLRKSKAGADEVRVSLDLNTLTLKFGVGTSRKLFSVGACGGLIDVLTAKMTLRTENIGLVLGLDITFLMLGKMSFPILRVTPDGIKPPGNLTLSDLSYVWGGDLGLFD